MEPAGATLCCYSFFLFISYIYKIMFDYSYSSMVYRSQYVQCIWLLVLRLLLWNNHPFLLATWKYLLDLWLISVQLVNFLCFFCFSFVLFIASSPSSLSDIFAHWKLFENLCKHWYRHCVFRLVCMWPFQLGIPSSSSVPSRNSHFARNLLLLSLLLLLV